MGWAGVKRHQAKWRALDCSKPATVRWKGKMGVLLAEDDVACRKLDLVLAGSELHFL